MSFATPIIAAFIGVAIGGILGPILLDWYFKPKLKIEKADPHHHSSVTFIRVTVKNNGKRGAKNCVGLITLNEVKPDEVVDGSAILNKGFFERGQRIEDSSLCWAVGQPAVTLNPKTPAALDVLRVNMHQNRKEWRICIPSERGWTLCRAVLSAKTDGFYNGELWVTAENADPAHCKFIVRFSIDDVSLDLDLQE